jgi:hypothetical protein
LRWVAANATDVVDRTCRTNRTHRTNGTDWSLAPQVKVFICMPGIQELQARCPEITLLIAVAAEGPLNFLLSVLDICPKESYIIDLLGNPRDLNDETKTIGFKNKLQFQIKWA